ncbi:MAG: hypothetical protein ACRDFB_10905 [Rhabdochlamydiaceae bacterium]
MKEKDKSKLKEMPCKKSDNEKHDWLEKGTDDYHWIECRHCRERIDG